MDCALGVPSDVLRASYGASFLSSSFTLLYSPIGYRLRSSLLRFVSLYGIMTNLAVALPRTLYLATKMIHSQTRERMSMSQLAELRVPIPPVVLQQRFALGAHRTTRRPAQQREALRQAEQLFQALLPKAFRGERGVDDAAAVETAAATHGVFHQARRGLEEQRHEWLIQGEVHAANTARSL